jgi:hypothetical protein
MIITSWHCIHKIGLLGLHQFILPWFDRTETPALKGAYIYQITV